LSGRRARDFQSIDLIEANLIEYMETLAIVSDELYARAMVGRGIHLMLKDKISGFPYNRCRHADRSRWQAHQFVAGLAYPTTQFRWPRFFSKR